MKTLTSVASLAVTILTLQGCAETPFSRPVSHATVYSTDVVGKAASCVVAPVTVKDGAENAVAMTTGGNGWCGVAVDQSGKPYAAGLLIKAPSAGKVYVHTVGDETRIDYTPARVPAGADGFSVRLLPGDAVIKVSVNTPSTGSK